MIRYWIRLTRMPATRLARRMFDWDHGRAKRGTGCHDMKQIFEKCDLIDAYNDKSDDPGLVNRVKNRLHQDDINQRRNDMMNMCRMKTYRVLNAAPLFVDTGPAPHLRVALTREQRVVQVPKWHPAAGHRDRAVQTDTAASAPVYTMWCTGDGRRRTFSISLSTIPSAQTNYLWRTPRWWCWYEIIIWLGYGN